MVAGSENTTQNKDKAYMHSLRLKLAVAIIIKLLALFALWIFLIRPMIVHVDTKDVSNHLIQPQQSDR